MKIVIAVVYDEYLMTHRHSFEALDRTSQDLCDNCKPFGGLTMVFGGDFQQILPVIPHGTQADMYCQFFPLTVISLEHNGNSQTSREHAPWRIF